MRSYQTLLRSTGEVRVAGLLEPYLAMAPSLHSRAREPLPDAAAITYVGLRLPPCMPSVRLVLLGASLESMAARGVDDIANWMPQTAPARRRRHFFDGHDRLAVLVSSPSDLDDIIPALVAYEIEWNKLHELLDRDHALRRLVERAAREGPAAGRRGRGCARRSGSPRPRCSACRSSGRAARGSCWRASRTQRKQLAVRMLGGTWNDYERAVERWFEYVADNVPPDLTQPTDLFRLEQHAQPGQSAVGLGDGAPGGHHRLHPATRTASCCAPSTRRITSDRVREQPREFPVLRGQEVPGRPAQCRRRRRASPPRSDAAGMTTLRVPFGPDVDAQVIELSKLRPDRLDRRLADLPALDRLAASDARHPQYRLPARRRPAISCSGRSRATSARCSACT